MVTLTLTLPAENIFFCRGQGWWLYGTRIYPSPDHYRKSRGVVIIEYHGGTVGYHRVSWSRVIIGGLQGIIEYHGQGECLCLFNFA